MLKSNKQVNKLLDLLGVSYPIIQAPMAGGATTKELVASVSNCGCLGSLGAGYMHPMDLKLAIDGIKKLTNLPFAVNLFIDNQLPIANINQKAAIKSLQNVSQELNMRVIAVDPPYAPDFNEQFEIILQEKVPVFSFTFGMLAPNLIKKLHANGTIVIGTATNVDEVRELFISGVDAIVVQGKEAGGHRGSFIGNDEQGLFSLKDLISKTKNIVPTPIIAAGGIMNASSITEHIDLGAFGVQMGSAFLASSESGISQVYKQVLLSGSNRKTCLTKAFSGKLARGLENTFIKRMQNYQSSILPYPIQNAQTMQIRAKAKELNNVEFMSLWAGENYFLCKDMAVEDLISELIVGM